MFTNDPLQGTALYSILLTDDKNVENDDYVLYYTNKTSGGFNVRIFEQDNGTDAGVAINNQFDFACMQGGVTFCHGSVSSAGAIIA